MDNVNHPKHYTSHPSGVECIQVTEHMGFNLGNAMKYIWRCDEKWDSIEDLNKAVWYINREIERREKINGKKSSEAEGLRGLDGYEYPESNWSFRFGDSDNQETSVRDVEYFVQRHETR
jgi:hypothetical protein